MSVEAITCALRIQLPPGNSTAKHVLTILANHANGDPYTSADVTAWPSIAALVESTGQDRKTVITNLQKLVEWGLIEDTGDRVGRTGQIVVYRLHVGPDLLSQQSQKRNGSKSGTVPNPERFRIRAETVPIFRGNSTDIGTRNRQEPKGTSREDIRARATDAGQLAAGVIREFGPLCRITSAQPAVVEAAGLGVTADLVIELHRAYPDKPVSYAVRAAINQIREGARAGPDEGTDESAATSGASHATRLSSHRESAADRVRRLAVEADQRDAAAGAAVSGVVGAHG